MSKRWTLPVQYNKETDEYFIEFTDEMMEASGFKPGDTLNWEDNKDGSYTMTKKKEETQFVLVETISQFRQRYVVEVPTGIEYDAATTGPAVKSPVLLVPGTESGEYFVLVQSTGLPADATPANVLVETLPLQITSVSPDFTWSPTAMLIFQTLPGTAPTTATWPSGSGASLPRPATAASDSAEKLS